MSTVEVEALEEIADATDKLSVKVVSFYACAATIKATVTVLHSEASYTLTRQAKTKYWALT